MTYEHFLANFSGETAKKSPEEIQERTIGILLPFSGYCSGVFLYDPITFSALSSGIDPFPEAGSIDLGSEVVELADMVNTIEEGIKRMNRFYKRKRE